MAKFTLTVQQIAKLLKDAQRYESQEDVVNFEIKSNRLIATQKDWSQVNTRILLNKPV